jgi:hypothetical protein
MSEQEEEMRTIDHNKKQCNWGLRSLKYRKIEREMREDATKKDNTERGR